MEPLGTITMYFPFIDVEIREILETTMNDAYDYSDFVHILTEQILETDCSDMIVYFTIYHAFVLFDLKSINSIVQKYGDRFILQPLVLFASAYQGNPEDYDKIPGAVDAILETNLDDWQILELHIMKFEADMRKYPESMYDTTTLETIQKMIDQNPLFEFYLTTLFDYFQIRADIDGDTESRILYIDKAIETARKFDDRGRLGDLLNKKARLFLDVDRNKAQELLLLACDVAKSIGVDADYAFSLDQLSTLEATRGEFNLAIENFQKVISIQESLGLPYGNTSLNLSTLYNVVHEPDSGHEWGLMAEEQYKNRPMYIPRAILNQAWSLILMRKMTEALVLIDSIREEVLKSGHETHLAWLHFVTGLLEIEDGDLTSAASSIEEALKIYENREGTLMFQMIFLRQLAHIEVSVSDMTTGISPSLALLEERAISEDLPGVLGQALVLKAEIALNQHDESNLMEILPQLESLTRNPKTVFLKSHYDSLLKRL